MEIKGQGVNRLPMYNECSFEGYNAAILMKETSKIRKLITKRGTMEMLVPLCCSTQPVRYREFRQLLKGFSSKTLARRLKELEKAGILERQAYNEIPPRVEYRLTNKGQELVGSVINLMQWMRKWSNSSNKTRIHGVSESQLTKISRFGLDNSIIQNF
jgi:DNA-binding HxlR family transcriptional regulator